MSEPKPGEVWKNVASGQRVTIIRIEHLRQMMNFYGVHVNVDANPDIPVVVYVNFNGYEERWVLKKAQDPTAIDVEARQLGIMQAPGFTDCWIPVSSAASPWSRLFYFWTDDNDATISSRLFYQESKIYSILANLF